MTHVYLKWNSSSQWRWNINSWVILGILLVAQLRCHGQIILTDYTATSHIDFIHNDGAELEGYLVSMMGSGLALFDFDRDGLIDVYFLNGMALPPNRTAKSTGNAIYRNLGDCQFANVSSSAMDNQHAFSLGVAVGDIDNDGFQDLAISNFGSVTVLHNCGDGTFTDWTNAAQLAEAGVAFGAGVAFLDMENDGDLDLYVADYVDFTFERFDKLAPTSYPYPPGPNQFPYRSDHLFENNGQGGFVDCSARAGIADIQSPSMGVVCLDFDSDGDSDIFVCSDAKPNLLLVNNGRGVFTQEAERYAVAYNAHGIPVGSMGAETGDINNDGLEDLFITDYSAQMPILFRNSHDFGFEDVSAPSRAGRDVVPHANWGAGLADMDNDGDRDLLIGNGHLFQWANQVEQLTSFKVPNTLLANDGRGVFTNVTATAGSGMSIVESARGVGLDDLDNDGDLDCVILNSDAQASVLRNETQSGNNWIEIEFTATQFNRDGVGAKISVHCGELVQFAEIKSGRGYQSHFGTRLHFGIGKHSQVDRVVVEFQGVASEYANLDINQLHFLTQW